MPLQFMLIQDTQANKQAIYEDINNHLQADDNNRVFYLVPNHMKFDMELNVLDAMKQFQSDKVQSTGMSGMMRLQVFSFQRLAWYLLQDQVTLVQNSLSEVGLTMLLRKILLDLQDELIIYRAEFNKMGFIQELANLFQELEIGNVDSESLATILENYGAQESPLVRNQLTKMAELTKIYAAYEERITNQNILQQEQYHILQQAIINQDLTNVLIVIDGFYRFNANELATIKELLQATEKVEVILSLDQPYTDVPPAWFELFTITGRTYFQLYQLTRLENIKLLTDQQGLPNSSVKAGFSVLDQTLRFARQGQGIVNVTADRQQAVSEVIDIWKCETPFIEAEQIANQIYQLVSLEGYRYKDIQILTRDIEHYKNRLIPHLERNNTPYFLDDIESMESHPLFRFLDSLYRIFKYNWRYQDIFNLLRSELLLPPFRDTDTENWAETMKKFRDDIDRTENVVIKNGYVGQRWWREDSNWSYIHLDENGKKVASDRDIETEQVANRLKAFVVGALQPLFDGWQQEELQTTEAITQFFQFMEQYSVPQQLVQWRNQQLDEGRLEDARHHEQAWSTFIDLLDEYVQIFSDDQFEVETFFNLLTIAFETATFSIVPPTIDSVTITSLDSQRVSASKITFVLGLTSKTLPKQYEEHSLLTTEDRELIADNLTWNQAFEPSAQTKASNEQFIAYKTFLSATDHLYISYPYNLMNEKQSTISPMVAQLIEWFDLEEVWKTDQNHTLTDSEQLILGNWRSQIHHFTMKLALAKADESAMPMQWQKVYDQLREHSDFAPALKKTMSSIQYSNFVVPLSTELAHALYGNTLRASVSQLELYNRDPFSYFLTYGLKLRERQVFELSPAQTGNYYHDVLQLFFDELLSQKLAIDHLTDEDISRILNPILANMKDQDQFPQYSIFTVNARHNYLQKQINETLQFMIKQLIAQRRVTHVRTVANELNFGGLSKTEETVNIEYELPDNSKVLLRGRIDRLDQIDIETEDGLKTFLQVVDYKSSKREVKFEDIYHGTNLQLYTYLLVALKYYRDKENRSKDNILPLGAFYEHIHDPIVKIKNQVDLDQLSAESILREFSLNGFILGDLDVLTEIDPTVETQTASVVYPYKLKKDGGFNSYSKILSLEQFEQLLRFSEDKIIETAIKIMGGQIPLQPFEKDHYVPAIMDPYRSVSQFDITDIYSNYRVKKKIDKTDDFFDLLTDYFSEEEEVEDHEEE